MWRGFGFWTPETGGPVTRRLAPFLLALALVACSGGPPKQASPTPPPPKDLGSQVGDAASDTAVMHEANDAANSVIRAGGDCDAVKAALDDANRRLDEAAAKLKTATGRTSLATLRRQVEEVASACP
jgi:hypothetical protein